MFGTQSSLEDMPSSHRAVNPKREGTPRSEGTKAYDNLLEKYYDACTVSNAYTTLLSELKDQSSRAKTSIHALDSKIKEAMAVIRRATDDLTAWSEDYTLFKTKAGKDWKNIKAAWDAMKASLNDIQTNQDSLMSIVSTIKKSDDIKSTQTQLDTLEHGFTSKLVDLEHRMMNELTSKMESMKRNFDDRETQRQRVEANYSRDISLLEEKVNHLLLRVSKIEEQTVRVSPSLQMGVAALTSIPPTSSPTLVSSSTTTNTTITAITTRLSEAVESLENRLGELERGLPKECNVMQIKTKMGVEAGERRLERMEEMIGDIDRKVDARNAEMVEVLRQLKETMDGRDEKNAETISALQDALIEAHDSLRYMEDSIVGHPVITKLLHEQHQTGIISTTIDDPNLIPNNQEGNRESVERGSVSQDVSGLGENIDCLREATGAEVGQTLGIDKGDDVEESMGDESTDFDEIWASTQAPRIPSNKTIKSSVTKKELGDTKQATMFAHDQQMAIHQQVASNQNASMLETRGDAHASSQSKALNGFISTLVPVPLDLEQLRQMRVLHPVPSGSLHPVAATFSTGSPSFSSSPLLSTSFSPTIAPSSNTSVFTSEHPIKSLPSTKLGKKSTPGNLVKSSYTISKKKTPKKTKVQASKGTPKGKKKKAKPRRYKIPTNPPVILPSYFAALQRRRSSSGVSHEAETNYRGSILQSQKEDDDDDDDDTDDDRSSESNVADSDNEDGSNDGNAQDDDSDRVLSEAKAAQHTNQFQVEPSNTGNADTSLSGILVQRKRTRREFQDMDKQEDDDEKSISQVEGVNIDGKIDLNHDQVDRWINEHQGKRRRLNKSTQADTAEGPDVIENRVDDETNKDITRQRIKRRRISADDTKMAGSAFCEQGQANEASSRRGSELLGHALSLTSPQPFLLPIPESTFLTTFDSITKTDAIHVADSMADDRVVNGRETNMDLRTQIGTTTGEDTGQGQYRSNEEGNEVKSIGGLRDEGNVESSRFYSEDTEDGSAEYLENDMTHTVSTSLSVRTRGPISAYNTLLSRSAKKVLYLTGDRVYNFDTWYPKQPYSSHNYSPLDTATREANKALMISIRKRLNAVTLSPEAFQSLAAHPFPLTPKVISIIEYVRNNVPDRRSMCDFVMDERHFASLIDVIFTCIYASELCEEKIPEIVSEFRHFTLQSGEVEDTATCPSVVKKLIGDRATRDDISSRYNIHKITTIMIVSLLVPSIPQTDRNRFNLSEEAMSLCTKHANIASRLVDACSSSEGALAAYNYAASILHRLDDNAGKLNRHSRHSPDPLTPIVEYIRQELERLKDRNALIDSFATPHSLILIRRYILIIYIVRQTIAVFEQGQGLTNT